MPLPPIIQEYFSGPRFAILGRMIKQAIGRLRTASKSITKTEFDALDLLTSDHMKAEAMLMQLRISHNGETRERLFKRVKADLHKHMRLEEELFYPACEQVEGLKSMVEHAYDEHQEFRDMLKSFADLSPTTKRYSEKLTKLIKTIEHHVIEEENELFPKVRKLMSKKDFVRLSHEMIQAHGGQASRRTKKAA
jgi:iron-sulfur cluster repair protein YtfE (RIC family)